MWDGSLGLKFGKDHVSLTHLYKEVSVNEWGWKNYGWASLFGYSVGLFGLCLGNFFQARGLGAESKVHVFFFFLGLKKSNMLTI